MFQYHRAQLGQPSEVCSSTFLEDVSVGKRRVGKDTPIQQHIGGIHTIDLSFTLTTTGPERDGEFIYSIQGEKGSGVVSVKADLKKEIVLGGFLELPDGKKYDLLTGDPIP